MKDITQFHNKPIEPPIVRNFCTYRRIVSSPRTIEQKLLVRDLVNRLAEFDASTWAPQEDLIQLFSYCAQSTSYASVIKMLTELLEYEIQQAINRKKSKL